MFGDHKKRIKLKCPVCGSKMEKYFHIRLLGLSDPLEYWECLNCGFDSRDYIEEEPVKDD